MTKALRIFKFKFDLDVHVVSLLGVGLEDEKSNAVGQNFCTSFVFSSFHTSCDLQVSKEMAAELLSRVVNTLRTAPTTSHHIIAFSGGVDSSLVSKIVYNHFSSVASVEAVIGVSPSLPPHQLNLARSVASKIGIPFRTVKTREYLNEDYLKNDGTACFHCKNSLYETLENVQYGIAPSTSTSASTTLYNGTNASDLLDPTRLGLISAKNFQVVSPLQSLTKAEVRRLSKYLGLDNWNYAASPCLRSRLEVGVRAEAEHLERVNRAEIFVRGVLEVDVARAIRVRLLAGGTGVVEIEGVVENEEAALVAANIREAFLDFGFVSFGGVRAFKSGSLAVVKEVTVDRW